MGTINIKGTTSHHGNINSRIIHCEIFTALMVAVFFMRNSKPVTHLWEITKSFNVLIQHLSIAIVILMLHACMLIINESYDRNYTINHKPNIMKKAKPGDQREIKTTDETQLIIALIIIMIMALMQK